MSSELLATVRSLYAAIERFDAALAQELGVDRTGLRAINAMERGPLSPGALGEALGLSSGAVTALLDRLEAAGHVTRQVSTEDRRRRDAILAPPTRRRAAAAYGALGAAITAGFAARSEADRRAAIAAIAALTAAFDAALTPPPKSPR